MFKHDNSPLLGYRSACIFKSLTIMVSLMSMFQTEILMALITCDWDQL